MLISDTHLHSFFSSDSDTPMEDMIQQGIKLGLQSLCFTEHHDHDFPVTEDGLDFQLNFDTYYDSWLKLKEKYSSKIELLHGVELGVQRHSGPALNALYADLGSRFDFIINSCHLVEGEDPYNPSFFQQRSFHEGICGYFENILENIKIFPHFQTAGHLDYICRYIPEPRPDFHFTDYQDILDAILRYLIENGKALEVNTAGLKYGLSWPNPHIDILKRYRELGGELLTIGSDAHRPEHMAYGFEQLPEILSSAGFHYYALFRKQKPVMIPID